MTVFRRAVKEVTAGQMALEAGELRGGDSTYFNRTIVILLHLVCLLTKLIPHLEKNKVSQTGRRMEAVQCTVLMNSCCNPSERVTGLVAECQIYEIVYLRH